MVDARSARFQGMVPGSWGAPPRPQPPAPQPPASRPQPGPSNPVSNVLNLFGSGLIKAAEPATQGVGQVMYPNTIAGINETGAPRASDVLTDAAFAGIGGALGAGAGKLVGIGLNTLRRANMSPAVQQTSLGTHRGAADLRLKHPRDVGGPDGQTIGPGTYLSDQAGGYPAYTRLGGDRSALYEIKMSPLDRIRLSRSQGYAGYDDVAQALAEAGMGEITNPGEINLMLNDMPWDSPVIQDLLRKGYIGFNPGKGKGFTTGEFTNWLVGATDVGKINRSLPSLSLQDTARQNAFQRVLQSLNFFQ